jgi:uncharacterized membrane protein (DUF441 family)
MNMLQRLRKVLWPSRELGLLQLLLALLVLLGMALTSENHAVTALVVILLVGQWVLFTRLYRRLERRWGLRE